MKTCPKCNMSGIPDEAKFCPECGAELSCSTTKGDDTNEEFSMETKKEGFHYFAAIFLFIPFFVGFYILIAVLFMAVGLDDCSWRTVTPVDIVLTLLVEYFIFRP